MTERARVIRLLSPEEVQSIREKHESLEALARAASEDVSPDNPYTDMIDATHDLILQLCYTLQDAWTKLDRLQRG